MHPLDNTGWWDRFLRIWIVCACDCSIRKYDEVVIIGVSRPKPRKQHNIKGDKAKNIIQHKRKKMSTNENEDVQQVSAPHFFDCIDC